MAVAKIMSRTLICAKHTDTLDTMRHLMKKHGIHHLLVLKENTLVGVISDRDILKMLSPYVGTKVESEKDSFTLNRQAHQIMSKTLVTITPKASIRDAARIYLEAGVSLLPVVDENNQPLGVISWKDILAFFVK